MPATTQSGSINFVLAGIPVSILPSFWLVTWVVGSRGRDDVQGLAIWAAVTLVSILVHEMGHALTARAFGREARIELHGMGGTAHHKGDDVTRSQRALISVAGPVAGIVLGAVVWAVARALPPSVETPLWQLALDDALWVNWGYGLLNLLPILPLDGGHVMQQGVDGLTGKTNHPASTIISLVIAAALLVASLVLGWRWGLFLLGWLFISHARTGWTVLQDWRDRDLEEAFKALQQAFAERNADALVDGGKQLRERAHGDRLKANGIHMQAWGHFLRGEYAAAVGALDWMPENYQRDPWVLGVSHLKLGQTAAAAELLGGLYEVNPGADVAEAFVEALLAEGRLDDARRVISELEEAGRAQEAANLRAHIH